MAEYEWIDAELIQASEERRRKRAKEKRLALRKPSVKVVDASVSIPELGKLAQTIANQLEREGGKYRSIVPLHGHLAMLLRQAHQTFALLCFINSDDQRDGGYGYRRAFSFVSLPLIRSMIDAFYSAVALISDPESKMTFERSGFTEQLKGIDKQLEMYAEDSEQIAYLCQLKALKLRHIEASGFNEADVRGKRLWPSLTEYLRVEPKETKIKHYLSGLTIGIWIEYAGIGHGTFQGLHFLFPYIAEDQLPRDQRMQMRENAEREITLHLYRAGGILACLLTEIEGFYGFEYANLKKRIPNVWRLISEVPDVKDLYEGRYKSMVEHEFFGKGPVPKTFWE